MQQNVRHIWKDGHGFFDIRLALSTQNAAVLSAVLAIILTFTIGRLLSFLYIVIYHLYLHPKSKSLIDDQTNVLAANAERPSSLLISLVELVRVAPRKALASSSYRTLVILGFFLLAIQAASLVGIGLIFLINLFQFHLVRVVGYLPRSLEAKINNNSNQIRFRNTKHSPLYSNNVLISPIR